MDCKNSVKFSIKIILISILGFNLLFGQNNSQLKKTASDSIKVSPTRALIMSGIIPGSGQLYAHSPIKAGIALGAEAFCIYTIHRYSKIDGYVDQTIKEVGDGKWDEMSTQVQKNSVQSVTGYSLGTLNPWEAEENLKKTVWWLAGVHLLNMLDAYVEAHLLNFPEDKIELSSRLNKKSMQLNLSIKF